MSPKTSLRNEAIFIKSYDYVISNEERNLIHFKLLLYKIAPVGRDDKWFKRLPRHCQARNDVADGLPIPKIDEFLSIFCIKIVFYNVFG
jgi:hypothetical protein